MTTPRVNELNGRRTAPAARDVQFVASSPTTGDGGAVKIVQGVVSFERVDFIDNVVANTVRSAQRQDTHTHTPTNHN